MFFAAQFWLRHCWLAENKKVKSNLTSMIQERVMRITKEQIKGRKITVYNCIYCNILIKNDNDNYLFNKIKNIKAIITNNKLETDLKIFKSDEIDNIVDFILREF